VTPPPVPFVDFRAHVAAVRGELDAAVGRVLDSGWFILGPEGEAFERELARSLGVADAVAVANGTDALHLALRALGVAPGDEVITSSLSAAFTAFAIVQAGARPVFVDVDPDTLNLDPRAVAAAVTARTKALVPVHLYGHPAPLQPLLDLAAERGLAVLEDACQAYGALYRGRPVGTIAPLGALSFYPTKNLGALGDGGAILCREAGLAARLRRLRNGGQSDRYRHEELGFNSRLDEIQAAILRVSLAHMSGWTARRRELAAFYHRELEGAGVSLPVEQDYATAVYHLFVVRHPRRDELARRLSAAGVGTLVHYPIPLHRQPAFAAFAPGRDLPVVERAAGEILSLPLYPELTEEQARAVVRAVREATAALRC